MTPGVGEKLRTARLDRDVELAEVEEATKIKARFLRAIEDGEWGVLPGRAYARGFVRTYAGFLDLDPDPLVAQLDRELEPRRPEEVPPEPVVQRGTVGRKLLARLGPRLVGAAAAAVLVVVLVVLGLTAGEDDGDTIPPPPPPVAEEPTDPEPPPEPEPESEPELASLTLNAIGAVWVCLVTGRGEALVDSETLAEGEERGPFEARRLLMTFGNGQIEMTADGEEIEVPEAANPLGYEVTPEGVEDLDPAERPTCV